MFVALVAVALLASLSNVHPSPAGAAVGSPSLDIEDLVLATPGGTATVDVSFAAGGASISSLILSVDYDQTLLSINPADVAPADGIPDAVSFSLPVGFTGIVASLDTADTNGELDIAVYSMPVEVLSDGVILSITFDVGNLASTTEAAVLCSLDPAASSGSNAGESVPGTCSDGSVRIVVDGVQPGDCDGSDGVTSLDIRATFLERFDGDGELPPYGGGTYPGTLGCDSNQDGKVTSLDIRCTFLRRFLQPCGAAPASPVAFRGTPGIGAPSTAMGRTSLVSPVNSATWLRVFRERHS